MGPQSCDLSEAAAEGETLEAPVGPQSCDLSEAAAEGETLLCSKSHILSEPAGECVRLSYPSYSFSKNFNSI